MFFTAEVGLPNESGMRMRYGNTAPEPVLTLSTSKSPRLSGSPLVPPAQPAATMPRTASNDVVTAEGAVAAGPERARGRGCCDGLAFMGCRGRPLRTAVTTGGTAGSEGSRSTLLRIGFHASERWTCRLQPT